MKEEISDVTLESEERFAFGKNWLTFLTTVDETRIATAQRSFCELLSVRSLRNRRFLDVGCGSGLSSLIASRLGADVTAFDYDIQSVTATRALKSRFAPNNDLWRIEQGSALDSDYLEHLGLWDIVYSWGVLHHTGSMWRAMDLVSQRVAPGGLLVIALYNDQGLRSRLWRIVKRLYVSIPLIRWLILGIFAPILWASSFVKETILGRTAQWWSLYRNQRGMSRWHDLVDWVGGYPFEVAASSRVIEFCEARGFRLERLIPTKRLGCNQFSFRKSVATMRSK